MCIEKREREGVGGLFISFRNMFGTHGMEAARAVAECLSARCGAVWVWGGVFFDNRNAFIFCLLLYPCVEN